MGWSGSNWIAERKLLKNFPPLPLEKYLSLMKTILTWLVKALQDFPLVHKDQWRLVHSYSLWRYIC